MRFDRNHLLCASIDAEIILIILQARALLAQILQAWAVGAIVNLRPLHSIERERLMHVSQLTIASGSYDRYRASTAVLNTYLPSIDLPVLELILKRLCLPSRSDDVASSRLEQSCQPRERLQGQCLDSLEFFALNDPAAANSWFAFNITLPRDGTEARSTVIFSGGALKKMDLVSSCSAEKLCQLAGALRTKHKPLKALAMHFMSRNLRFLCTRVQARSVSKAFLHDMVVSSDVQLQLRSDLQMRINFERRQRRLHFSEYVVGLAELIRSLSRVETRLLCTKKVEDHEITMIGTPRLDGATPNSLRIAWATPALQRTRIFKLEVADQVHGASEASATYRAIYRGLHAGAIINGLSPSRTYFFRVGFEYLHATCSNRGANMVSSFNFSTEHAPPFIFDALNKGPAIVLSKESTQASFCASESWATILGSAPFISGCNAWELEIINSSSLYIFVGAATRETDLATFLGGDSHSWGYIGDRALYHKRTKMKLYGERFGHGDTIGVLLNMDYGSLSFSKNSVDFGMAFDGIMGEVYPAIAFYSKGQQVALVENSFHCPGAGDVLPGSAPTFNFDQSSDVLDLMSAMLGGEPLTGRSLNRAYRYCQSWLRGCYYRVKSCCGPEMQVKREADCANLSVGQYVSTPRGNACVLGDAFGLLWFDFGVNNGAWFFTYATVRQNALRGYFRAVNPGLPNKEKKSVGLHTYTRCIDGMTFAHFHRHVRELSQGAEVNKHIVQSIDAASELHETCAWNLDAPTLIAHLDDTGLYSGVLQPTHESAACRVSLILMFNEDLLRGFPFLVNTHDHHQQNCRKQSAMISGLCPHVSRGRYRSKVTLLRGSIFGDTKHKLFRLFATHTMTRAKRAEDDYDYPEDLPQIVINRLKATTSPAMINQEAS